MVIADTLSPYCGRLQCNKCIGKRWDQRSDDVRPCTCPCHREKKGTT